MTKEQLQAKKWLEVNELNEGDKIKLTDGNEALFVRLKQKNFIAIINNKRYDVPVTMYDHLIQKSEVKEKEDNQEYTNLRKGELFYIVKNERVIIFFFEANQNGRIIGINPVTKDRVKIDVSLYGGRVSDLKPV